MTFMDRDAPKMATCQTRFISFFALEKYFEITVPLSNLRGNLDYCSKLSEEEQN